VTTFIDAARVEGDPARKFALQSLARDMAIASGDWEGGLKAVVETAQEFDVDAFELAEEVRAKLDLADNPPLNPKRAFLLTVQLVDSASSKDRYDVAEHFALSAQKIARKAGDTISSNQIAARLPDLQRLSRQYDAVKAALATLEGAPLDAPANLAVGKFRCYAQGRWDEGLTLLALGSDAGLAQMAEIELRAEGQADQLVKLADRWWDVPGMERDELLARRRHAVDLYLQGMSRLEGIEAKRVEARLADAEKWHSKDATYLVSPSSHPYDKAHPPLPSLVSASERMHTDGGAAFAFHISDPRAYIVIDLKREAAVSRIEIVNSAPFVQAPGARRGPNRGPPGGADPSAARNMVVHLSISPDSRGEQVWRAERAEDQWVVRLPKLHMARYVTIALSPGASGAYLHLRKVKVFGPD
jgi:hypothetical protein